MNFFTNGLIAIGIFLGITIVIVFEFYVDFFGDSLKISETLVATVLGAAIALIGTVCTIYASIEANEKKQKLVDCSLAYQLLAKFMDVNDHLVKQKRHLLNGDQRTLFLMDSKTLKKPLSGDFTKALFSSEERALVLRYRLDKLFNTIPEVQGLQDVLCFVQKRHEETFNAFIERITSGQSFDISGKAVSLERLITPQDRLDIANIENLEQHLRELANDGTTHLDEAMKELMAFIGKEFGHHMEFSLSNERTGSRIV